MIRRTSTFALLCLLCGVFGFAPALSAKEAKPVKWMRGIYVAESPRPEQVPAAIAMSVASAKARAIGGAAIRGHGASMQPLYDNGVIMVVAPHNFADLKRGQTVVYENREGRNVAHVLVAKCKRGWRVTGLNNRTHDGQGVNAGNFRGLVIEAITPVSGQGLASR